MGCTASKPNIINTVLSEEDNPSSSTHSSSTDNTTTTTTTTITTRALSLQTPLVHHPPSKKGDSHHLVSLTSTTYGSLLLIDPIDPKLSPQQQQERPLLPPKPSNIGDNPKTETDPSLKEETLSPDSVINTWELMDGLDDDGVIDDSVSGFRKIQSFRSRSSLSDYSFEKGSSFMHLASDGSVFRTKVDSFVSTSRSEEIVAESKSSITLSKPLWKHMSEESLLSNMDPIVISSYRRALSSRQLGYKNKGSKNANSLNSSPMHCLFQVKNGIFLPGTEEKIVVFFTSLRGIRKTYEDCYAVRMIFRGFRVPVDERDISMDSNYRKDLQNVLKGNAISLPQVFVRGKHIGGVEEVKQLNELGELAKLLNGFPVMDPGLVCDGCGDARFVPCLNCNGSRKVFNIEEDQLRRCPNCNENGLIRCPGCCS